MKKFTEEEARARRNEYARQYRLANPEKCREAVRRWAAKNNRSKYYRDYELVRPNALVSTLLRNSKTNAKNKKIEHNITADDISIPEKCPSCKKELTSRSLDRVDNSKGYIKGNVCVICWPCNQNKREYDAEGHRQIADYIDNFFKK